MASAGWVAGDEVDEFSIDRFLAAEQAKDLLRFTTAGSVDDGKSTLIGRLLYDSRNVYEDHVRAVTRRQGESTSEAIDFAQLTDGLRAEREQGITIDVAYRYFSTAHRKFIIADTPGHEQYTRNMATGASTADLAIVLVDARKGLLVQSRRHAYIAALLGIPHVAAAVNKMDLVDYSEAVFAEHSAALAELATKLGIRELTVIPVSALEGDNVVERSGRMPWYGGPSLLEHLERVPVQEREAGAPFRLPVQRVIRPHQHFRGFAGQIAAGTVRPGDEIVALPSGRRSRVRSISTFDGDLEEAVAPLSVTLTLEDELDISRGEMIAAAKAGPEATTSFAASLVWLDETPLEPNRRYLLKHTTQITSAEVRSVVHRVDIHTLAEQHAESLAMNEIGVVEVATSRPLFVDPYAENRATGSFILIDPLRNATVGAGMVRQVIVQSTSVASAHGTIVDLRGASASLAAELEHALASEGLPVVRTRVADAAVWKALIAAGVVTVVEGEDDGGTAVRLYIGDAESGVALEAADAASIAFAVVAAVRGGVR